MAIERVKGIFDQHLREAADRFRAKAQDNTNKAAEAVGQDDELVRQNLLEEAQRLLASRTRVQSASREALDALDRLQQVLIEEQGEEMPERILHQHDPSEQDSDENRQERLWKLEAGLGDLRNFDTPDEILAMEFSALSPYLSTRTRNAFLRANWPGIDPAFQSPKTVKEALSMDVTRLHDIRDIGAKACQELFLALDVIGVRTKPSFNPPLQECFINTDDSVDPIKTMNSIGRNFGPEVLLKTLAPSAEVLNSKTRRQDVINISPLHKQWIEELESLSKAQRSLIIKGIKVVERLGLRTVGDMRNAPADIHGRTIGESLRKVILEVFKEEA